MQAISAYPNSDTDVIIFLDDSYYVYNVVENTVVKDKTLIQGEDSDFATDFYTNIDSAMKIYDADNSGTQRDSLYALKDGKYHRWDFSKNDYTSKNGNFWVATEETQGKFQAIFTHRTNPRRYYCFTENEYWIYHIGGAIDGQGTYGPDTSDGFDKWPWDDIDAACANPADPDEYFVFKGNQFFKANINDHKPGDIQTLGKDNFKIAPFVTAYGCANISCDKGSSKKEVSDCTNPDDCDKSKCCQSDCSTLTVPSGKKRKSNPTCANTTCTNDECFEANDCSSLTVPEGKQLKKNPTCEGKTCTNAECFEDKEDDKILGLDKNLFIGLASVLGLLILLLIIYLATRKSSNETSSEISEYFKQFYKKL